MGADDGFRLIILVQLLIQHIYSVGDLKKKGGTINTGFLFVPVMN